MNLALLIGGSATVGHTSQTWLTSNLLYFIVFLIRHNFLCLGHIMLIGIGIRIVNIIQHDPSVLLVLALWSLHHEVGGVIFVVKVYGLLYKECEEKQTDYYLYCHATVMETLVSDVILNDVLHFYELFCPT